MTAPRAVRPGRPVRGSSTGRPVMAALDLLGRRWTLRLLWELRDGPLGARTILGRCSGLSSSVLYQRLRDLTASGLIERDGDDYALTPIGASLRKALQPLDTWANRWANATARAEPLS
jgi:DNA-binding HxlR family transcriptional regulator